LNEESDKPIQQEVHEYKMQQLLRKQFISLDDDLHKDYVPKNIDVLEGFDYKEKKLLEDFMYMQLGLISGVVVLYLSPEFISQWTTEQKKIKGMDKKWLKNVKEGPRVDDDQFYINYIGHPISGAYYYTMARNDGYDWFGSFVFSFFVSTFVWEYGYEAFAEVPSVQDIISTPVLGSLLGEGLYYLEKQLDENGGVIYGSRTLGNVAYAFLNPLGRISDTLSETFGISTTMRIQTYQTSTMFTQDYNHLMQNRPYPYSNYNYGIVISFEF
jgi:hypothetical protein